MHDPEFDEVLPKKGAVAIGEDRATPLLILRWLTERIPRWPIPRPAQFVFAESFREAIVEGFPVDRSLRLAAEVNPSRRFKAALTRAAIQVRSGYPLDVALEKSREKVLPGLRSALRVGEENGCLAQELASFARRTGKLTRSRYLLTIGRSVEAVDFAAALGRLLRDQRLTVGAVRGAGEVASSGKLRFAKVVQDLSLKMENGWSFADSLGQHPGDFDELYRGFIGAASSREEMMACLDRLGSSG